MKKKGSLLIMANFSDTTGYAWHNIYSLFGSVALNFKKNEIDSYISFPEIDASIKTAYFDNFDEKLVLESNLNTFPKYFSFYKAIKKLSIKHVYLTDRPHASFQYLIMRLMGVKNIVVHNRISVASPYLTKKEGFLKGTLKWLHSRIPGFSADCVICVSHFVSQRLTVKDRCSASKLVVIHNGVDVNKFDNRSDVITQKQNHIVFLSGRASPHKGINLAIEAAKILQTERTENFLFRYAGDGPDMEKLRQLVIKAGLENSFIFLGQLPSVDKEIAQADIILVPSAWGDAFPSAVIEAIASGKPTISAKAGGIPEIYGDENSKLLVEPGDSVDLARKISFVIDNTDETSAITHTLKRRAHHEFTTEKYHTNVFNRLKLVFLGSN